MELSSHITNEMIEDIVSRQLGSDRVISVESRLLDNDDGNPVIRIKVIYTSEDSLTVDEMEQVLDAIWLTDRSAEAPFPVVDFQEDTDEKHIAAE